MAESEFTITYNDAEKILGVKSRRSAQRNIEAYQNANNVVLESRMVQDGKRLIKHFRRDDIDKVRAYKKRGASGSSSRDGTTKTSVALQIASSQIAKYENDIKELTIENKNLSVEIKGLEKDLEYKQKDLKRARSRATKYLDKSKKFEHKSEELKDKLEEEQVIGERLKGSLFYMRISFGVVIVGIIVGLIVLLNGEGIINFF